MGTGSGSKRLSAGSYGGGSNTKYHGFTIIDQNGKEMNLVVVNGKIEYADGSINPTSFLSNELDVFQNFYDQVGSVDAIIQRINQIGKAKASVLSDKKVDNLRKKRQQARQASNQNYNPRHNRKGINRHTAYWSAM